MSLDQLYPEGKVIMLAGSEVTVHKFMCRRFGTAAKLGKPLMLALFGSGLLKADGEKITISETWPLVIVDVLAEYTDTLIDFCAFAIDKPVDYFDVVDPAELIDLARAIFEVNWDFIQARVLPNLGVNVAAPSVSGDGTTPSTPSLPQDISGQMSMDTR